MRARKKKNTVPRLERVKEYLTDHIEPNDTLPVHVEVVAERALLRCLWRSIRNVCIMRWRKCRM